MTSSSKGFGITDADESPEPGRPVHRRLPRTPALDGLRGIAVAAVLAYHHSSVRMPGGWLGVSLFFTLSGFLIGGLLLAEFEESGRIDLRAFWQRRIRRLVPASLVAVGLAVVVIAYRFPVENRSSIHDVRAALAQVANWRFILADVPYASADAVSSPVQHYWSLAIEEQFYLLVPVLAVIALRRHLFGWLAVALVVGSTAAQVVIGADLTRVYFGTDTRMAELGVGLLLAWAYPSLRLLLDDHRRALDALGAVVLFLTATLFLIAPLTGRLLGGGMLTAVSGLWVVLVLVATNQGWVAAVLAWRPLAALGRISYGVYLFHWPVYLVLNEDRVGVDGPPLFLVRTAVAIGIATVSYHLVELPIRRPTVTFRRLVPVGLVVVATLVGATAILGGRTFTDDRDLFAVVAPPPVASTSTSTPTTTTDTTLPPGEVVDDGPDSETSAPIVDADSDQRTESKPLPTGTPSTPTTTRPAPVSTSPPPIQRRVPRVLLIGDSSAMRTGRVIQEIGAADGVAEVHLLALPGCTTLMQQEVLLREDAPWHSPCGDIFDQALAAATDIDPDAVVVMLGSLQVADARYEGIGSTYRSFLDPAVVSAYTRRVGQAMDSLAHLHVPVLWADLPTPTYDLDNINGLPTSTPGVGPYTGDDPALTAKLNAIDRQAANARPHVERWSYAAALGVLPGRSPAPTRIDGLHIDLEQAPAIVRTEIFPRLTAAYRAAVAVTPPLSRPTAWLP